MQKLGPMTGKGLQYTVVARGTVVLADYRYATPLTHVLAWATGLWKGEKGAELVRLVLDAAASLGTPT